MWWKVLLCAGLVAVAVSGVGGQGDACPANYERALGNGPCLRFSAAADRQSYQDARQTCEGEGGRLVVIKDAALNTFIVDRIKATYQAETWIGLDELDGPPGVYTWSDGSVLQPGDFEDWSGVLNVQQPDSTYGEECVEIRAPAPFLYDWNNHHCRYRKNYVCEIVPDCPCDLDVMFLVDGSSSIGSEGFALAKEYIAHFINCFDCPRIGFILCKCEVNTSIPLCYYDNVRDATTAVGEIETCPSLTRIGYCIKHMQCTTDWKEGVPSIVVILTDGRIYGTIDGRYTEDVIGYAEAARDAGMEVYAGAIGREVFVDETALEAISGSEDRTFNTFDEDPSVLVAILTIRHCGYCYALVKYLPEKRPYPWEVDTPGRGGGRWRFWRRHLGEACEIVMSPDCWHYLLWCQTGLENAIEDLWTRVSDYAENIEFRVTERTVVAGKTLEDILEHMEDQESKGAIGEIIAEFGSCIQEVISAFNQVMGKLRTKINEYIQSFFLTIFCDLVDYWDNIVGRIREYFRRFFTDIFNDFCELLDALIEKLSDLITKWTWLFSDKVNRFLQYVLRLARCYLRFKDLVDMFANRVARLLCRFLWWVIRRYYGISFIYPQPYEIPFIFEDLPVAPAYP